MRIKCIRIKDDKSNIFNELTIGKIYNTFDDESLKQLIKPDRYLLYGDNKSALLVVPKYMFITVDEMRDELLNGILDES